MGHLSHQSVGLIELTPSSDSTDWQPEDATLEATFRRLVARDSAGDCTGSRSPRASRSDGASASVIYVDSEQLERELYEEWCRLRALQAD